ncbi:hypothetical protein glysoja_006567 [Glycine soja]|nr:hypothetical protein glysoja_006567 [Glycine soja]
MDNKQCPMKHATLQFHLLLQSSSNPNLEPLLLVFSLTPTPPPLLHIAAHCTGTRGT